MFYLDHPSTCPRGILKRKPKLNALQRLIYKWFHCGHKGCFGAYSRWAAQSIGEMHAFPASEARENCERHITTLCVCMCVYMCTCMHVYMYAYVCMYICVCVCVYICIHTHMCVYVCAHISACIREYGRVSLSVSVPPPLQPTVSGPQCRHPPSLALRLCPSARGWVGPPGNGHEEDQGNDI